MIRFRYACLCFFGYLYVNSLDLSSLQTRQQSSNKYFTFESKIGNHNIRYLEEGTTGPAVVFLYAF